MLQMALEQTEAEHQAELARPTSSIREVGLLRRELQDWLTDRLGTAADPVVDNVVIPAANGMSSETIVFDATWLENGERQLHPLVARVAPGETTMPIFPTYDMAAQFRTMRAVSDNSSVPVPTTYWSESDPAALGGPFFVMQRIEGQVPPDVMPYNFGSWVTEATDDERARLQRNTVGVLANLHAIDLSHFDFLGSPPSVAETAMRDHIAAQRTYYEWATTTGPRSPLIERCLDELSRTCPTDGSPTVFSWGDARIGNVMYRNFEPVAVLDWEMASFGPRELDLGWLIFLHRFFEDLTTLAGMPGLPGFLRRDDVAHTYRELSGHTPHDLDFYVFFAAVRQATIMFRVQSRAIRFGQAVVPDNPDEMILHHATLEKMLAGTYWTGIA